MENLHLWHDLSAMDILVEASTASRLTRILMRLKSILGIDRYWQDRSGILRNHWPEDQARR